MVEGTVVAGAQEMPAGARGAPLAKQPRGLQEEQRGGRRLCAGCSSCVLKSRQASLLIEDLGRVLEELNIYPGWGTRSAETSWTRSIFWALVEELASLA